MPPTGVQTTADAPGHQDASPASEARVHVRAARRGRAALITLYPGPQGATGDGPLSAGRLRVVVDEREVRLEGGPTGHGAWEFATVPTCWHVPVSDGLSWCEGWPAATVRRLWPAVWAALAQARPVPDWHLAARAGNTLRLMEGLGTPAVRALVTRCPMLGPLLAAHRSFVPHPREAEAGAAARLLREGLHVARAYAPSLTHTQLPAALASPRGRLSSAGWWWLQHAAVRPRVLGLNVGAGPWAQIEFLFDSLRLLEAVPAARLSQIRRADHWLLLNESLARQGHARSGLHHLVLDDPEALLAAARQLARQASVTAATRALTDPWAGAGGSTTQESDEDEEQHEEQASRAFRPAPSALEHPAPAGARTLARAVAQLFGELEDEGPFTARSRVDAVLVRLGRRRTRQAHASVVREHQAARGLLETAARLPAVWPAPPAPPAAGALGPWGRLVPLATPLEVAGVAARLGIAQVFEDVPALASGAQHWTALECPAGRPAALVLVDRQQRVLAVTPKVPRAVREWLDTVYAGDWHGAWAPGVHRLDSTALRRRLMADARSGSLGDDLLLMP